jgi:hypothetical protein
MNDTSSGHRDSLHDLATSRFAEIGGWYSPRAAMALLRPGRILIQVWDGDDQMPTRQEADPSAESGRGLLIVESLATDWGASHPANSSGKVVWAIVAQASG